jgi:hypothetical protein
MKKLILLFLLLLVAIVISAQVPSILFEEKDAFETFKMLKPSELKTQSVKKMQQIVNVEKLLKEDKENEGLDIPFRFGYGFDVNYTLKDGSWEERDSMKIWSLKISSPGAYSLNFIFEDMFLSPNAELYIFNPNGLMVYGPVTAKHRLILR